MVKSLRMIFVGIRHTLRASLNAETKRTCHLNRMYANSSTIPEPRMKPTAARACFDLYMICPSRFSPPCVERCDCPSYSYCRKDANVPASLSFLPSFLPSFLVPSGKLTALLQLSAHPEPARNRSRGACSSFSPCAFVSVSRSLSLAFYA